MHRSQRETKKTQIFGKACVVGVASARPGLRADAAAAPLGMHAEFSVV